MKSSLVRMVMAFALVICPASCAHALSAVTGSRLLRDCRAAIKLQENISMGATADENAGSSACIAYVEGVLDGNGFWKTIDERDHHTEMPHYCVVGNATVEVVIRLLVQYLEANPKELTENGWVCIQGAMLKSYPCKN